MIKHIRCDKRLRRESVCWYFTCNLLVICVVMGDAIVVDLVNLEVVDLVDFTVNLCVDDFGGVVGRSGDVVDDVLIVSVDVLIGSFLVSKKYERV